MNIYFWAHTVSHRLIRVSIRSHPFWSEWKIPQLLLLSHLNFYVCCLALATKPIVFRKLWMQYFALVIDGVFGFSWNFSFLTPERQLHNYFINLSFTRVWSAQNELASTSINWTVFNHRTLLKRWLDRSLGSDGQIQEHDGKKRLHRLRPNFRRGVIHFELFPDWVNNKSVYHSIARLMQAPQKQCRRKNTFKNENNFLMNN